MKMKYLSLAYIFIAILVLPSKTKAQTLDWVVSTGAATTFSGGYGIAHDDLGNVYVTGRFTGTIDFDPGAGVTNLTSAGAQDTYITKMDAAGNLVWAKRVGGPNDVYSFDVAVDEAGNVYVTGAFSGTADFDPGPGTFNLSSIGLFFDEIFVLKLDVNGDLAWARKMGSSDFDFGRSIAVSAAGNVFTTGSFRGTVDFDPGPGTSLLTSAAGGNDIFISKLNSSGNFVWAKRLGGTSSDTGYAITLDAAENVYTTGSFSTTADFDPGASVFNLTEVNNGDIFISKLDPSGNFVWAKGMGGTSSDVGYGIQVDYAGNIYTTGYFHTTVDFDPGPGTASLVSAGFNDAFISKLDANGNYQWAKGMGGISDEESSGLALDAYGNVYATGGFESTVDFDPGPGTFNLTPVGSGGGFVVKLDEAGDFVWAQAFEGSGRTTPEEIDVDIYGSIYTTGRFNGTVDFDTGPGVSNATAAGSNDTFIHKMLQAATPPTITSFAPTMGPIGTTVIIDGTSFRPTPSNNIVYFGATQATVTVATPTQLTVTVPTGATYQPITVLVNGLTAYSSKPFVVTFADGGVIDACSFAPKADVTTGSEPYSIAIGDLDNDGKPDLALANKVSNTVSVFKNISTLGSITPGSFAAKVDFITNLKPYYVGIHDLDGDGKPELIVSNNDSDNVSIYKNTTTTGVINASSFAAKVDFATGENPWNVTINDFDLDGKPDLAVVNDVSNDVSVLRNQTTTGSITAASFAPAVNFATGSFPIGIDSKDLNGDDKSDLVVTNQAENSISILRNTSTVGSITATSFAAKVDLAVGLDPYSVSIGDLNDNGKPEVVVANFSSGTLSVFDNNSTSGSIAFLPKVDFTSGAGALDVKLSDIDGDGKPDAVVSNGGSRISILKNLNSSSPIATGSLSPPQDFTSTSNPYGVAIGDIDGNGKPDMAATNYNGSTVSILRNTVSSLPTFTGGSFGPTSGPVGTVVTLTGTNFSTTPLNNTITFNGVPALVTASSSTNITAIVPVGATTGSISIEIGCVKAFTVLPFTVTGGNTIAITQQPGFTYACEGSTATFSVDATGTTNIAYKWQKFDGSDFTDINDGSEYSGTTTKSLSINTTVTGFGGNGQYQCRVNGDGAPEVISNAAQLTINGLPSPPDVVSTSSCGPGSITLTASGGSPGNYQWYTTSPLTLISGETNETYTTPVLSASTQYAVSVSGTFCKSLPANVTALVNPLPAKPVITSSVTAVGNAITICSTTTLTLSAPTGFTDYLWSDGSIAQQISVTTAGTYSVVVKDAQGCSSPASDGLTVTIVAAPCNNSAPVINTTTVTTTIGGQASINLLDLISDADNNLVPSSLSVIVQPTSGATTSITNGILLIDYTGINFTGTDQLTIQVCDVFGECVQQQLEIKVIGELEIYNAVSPNGDELNDTFKIQYIDLLPDTQKNKVTIYNRWGSKVFEVENYNNTTNVFKGFNDNGNELPSGTYFYKIAFDGRKSETGYLVIKK
jgi:gliding motility-associated-like protein